MPISSSTHRKVLEVQAPTIIHPQALLFGRQLFRLPRLYHKSRYLRRCLITSRRLLLLLCTFMHIRVYRNYYYWQLTTTNELEPSFFSQPDQHIFIYQSYLYPRGNKAFSEPSNTTTLATLFVADERRDLSNLTIYCVHWGRIGGVFTERLPLLYTVTPIRQGVYVRMIELPMCRLHVHVALCEFLGGEVGEEEESLGNFGLTFRSRRWDEQNAGDMAEMAYIATPHLLKSPSAIPLGSVKLADTTPRQLVLCVSRVFAFENWRLLVTALEVYRRLGVDLVVTHVLSAVSPLFALMRHYEFAEGGLLRVKPAVVFPMLRLGAGPDAVVYDANAETLHTNQLTAAHECLYEYKASADFIALVDWDDLLVTGERIQPPNSLPTAFKMALKDYPHAAYFNVNKRQASMPNPNKSNFYDLLTTLRGIRTSQIFFEHKMVVMPSRLLGFHIHLAENFATPDYREVQLPTEYAFMLHLNSKAATDTNFLEDGWLNRTGLGESHSDSDARKPPRPDYVEMLDALHHLMPIYVEKIGRCARLQRVYFLASVYETECLGYHLCNLRPAPGVKCVSTKNWYRHHRAGSLDGGLVVHVRHASALIEGDQGCVV